MTAIDADACEHLDGIMRIQQNLTTRRQARCGLAGALGHLRRASPDLVFPDSVIEGLDTIFHVLSDVARERDPQDMEMLKQMTSDEGNGTSSVRTAYRAGENAIDHSDRIHLVAATNYCERLVWQSGEICRSYEKLRVR